METLYWKTFITVAELGSFSKAAERLHITQSAVSRRVAALETHYGLKLLDRTGGTVDCSPAGRMVLDTARGILALEHKIAEDLGDMEPPKRIHLGCTPNFSATYLPGIMASLPELGRPLHLAITMSPTLDLVDAFRLGQHDVVFFEHCSAGTLDLDNTIELAQDDVVFVSSPSCGLPPGAVDLDQLFRHTLYCCGPRCCTRQLLDANLASVGQSVSAFQKIVEVTDLHLLRRSLVEQCGVSFASADFVAADLDTGRLSAHRIEGFRHTRSLVLAARDAGLLTLWESHFLAVHAGTTPGGDPPLFCSCGAS